MIHFVLYYSEGTTLWVHFKIVSQIFSERESRGLFNDNLQTYPRLRVSVCPTLK